MKTANVPEQNASSRKKESQEMKAFEKNTKSSLEMDKQVQSSKNKTPKPKGMNPEGPVLRSSKRIQKK